MIWHSHTITDVLTELRVDPSVGLPEQEVAQRLKEYGKNCLQEQTRRSFRQSFLQRMRSPLSLLPLATAGAALFAGIYRQVLKDIPADWFSPVAVAVLTVAIALLNTLRHHRAAAAAASLHTLSAAETRVRRDGAEQPCSTHSLVPGDVVLLGVGDIVPADCRLIEAEGLRCDEGNLTGATMPTVKCAECEFDDITALAQRSNMLYAGTVITRGTATAVVVATGVRSEMGHTHGGRTRRAESLPIPKEIRRLDLWWRVGIVVIGVVALIIVLVHYEDRWAALMAVAAMVAAAIPYGIAALQTQQTADGLHRIHRHRVRVHHPEAMDSLGRVTVIGIEQDMLRCNENATLCRAFVGHRIVDLTADAPEAPGLAQLMRLAALNAADADPSDAAILAYLPKIGIDKNELLLDMPRIGELTPSYERRTAVHLAGEQSLTLVSGEWRTLLPLCIKGNAEEITNAATAMEREGLQVMAVTYRLTDTAPTVYTADVLEKDLTCVGLLGLRLPLRTDAPAPAAGIRTILFSDESTAIAAATARNAGLTDTPYAATGEAIQCMTDEDLANAVRHYNVYCGLDIAQKERILSLWQAQGDVVALTASHNEETALLTAADVGFARGSVATDIVKDAADLILSDDGYAAIVAAVTEGRRLYWKKRSAVTYLLICAGVIPVLGFCCMLGGMSFSGGAILLLALHLLLMALPTPLWVAKGISNVAQKLCKK